MLCRADEELRSLAFDKHSGSIWSRVTARGSMARERGGPMPAALHMA